MPNTQRVYIGNLASDARERDVEKFLKGYGKFGEVSLKQGYGFVDFEDYRDADDAVSDLNGKDLLGERVRVQLAHDRRDRDRGSRGGRDGGRRGFGGRRSPGRFGDRRGGDRFGSGIKRGVPPGRKTNHRIIVENLSSRTSWQDLKDYFRSAGDVNYCTAHKLRNGEGLVEFTERRAMETALEKLDNTELHGKKLRLTEEAKMMGGGRSRSRSPRRSRSRSPRRSTSRSRERSVPRKEKSPVAHSRSRSPAERTSKSRSPRRSRSPRQDDRRSRSRSRS